MKEIKIFLASSEELKEERVLFGDFFSSLRRTFKQQGYDLELVRWEDLHSGFTGEPKQEEYIEEVKQCQLFVALFRTKAGKYTLQELQAARTSLEENKEPIIYLFMRNLAEGEQEQEELARLKEIVLKEWKHYHDSYNHPDTLKLRFLQQLLIYVNNPKLALRAEDSQVRFDGMAVADFRNLPFAANSDYYRQLQEEIRNTPADQPFRLAQLRKTISDYERDLLSTSQKLAAIKLEQMNERLRQARDLFGEGRLQEAKALLDEATLDREDEEMFSQMEAIQKEALSKIATRKAKAQIMLTDYANPNRFDEAEACYEKALAVARRANIDGDEMYNLLWEYVIVLRNYARYDHIDEIANELLMLTCSLYGEEQEKSAEVYNMIGVMYWNRGEINNAIDYIDKSVRIYETLQVANSVDAGGAYNNLGLVYNSIGKTDSALECFLNALTIAENAQGKDHIDTVAILNNIGMSYSAKGEKEKAMEYYLKALDINENSSKKDTVYHAQSYVLLGNEYLAKGEVGKALEYHKKSLPVYQKWFGEEHPQTALAYNNIGLAYHCKKDYPAALTCYQKALAIYEKVLGPLHAQTCNIYWNLSILNYDLDNTELADDFLRKAAEGGNADAQHLLADHESKKGILNRIFHRK